MTLNDSCAEFYKEEQRMLAAWVDAELVLDLDRPLWLARSSSCSSKARLREEEIPLSVLAADTLCPGEVARYSFSGIFTRFVIRWNVAARTPRLFNPEAL